MESHHMSEQDAERGQDPDRQTGSGAQGASGSQAPTGQRSTGIGASASQSSSSTRGETRSDRERGIESGRELGRPRRAESGGLLQRQGAGLSPWGGAASSPFAFMRRMMEDIDRLFESTGAGRGTQLSPWSRAGELDEWSRPIGRQALWAPPIEVFDRGNDLIIRADLPGLSKGDVDVNVENGVLTISGERKSEHEDEREGFFRSERSYGSFARSLVLPDNVNEDKVKASFKDGVLEVTVPRVEEEKAGRRKIDVS